MRLKSQCQGEKRPQICAICIKKYGKSKSYNFVTFKIAELLTLNVRILVEIADFKQRVWIKVEKYTCEIRIKSIYSMPIYKKIYTKHFT